MSILIKGIEMPQEKKITLTIFPDGRVYENHGERLWGHGKDCIPWKAVPVPPHGRLIDADALMELYADTDDLQLANMKVPIAVIRQNIMDMPTIIEAEEGE